MTKTRINPFEIGDVLYGNIGYTMEIPAWYQVVSVTPCTVKVKRRKEKILESHDFQGYSTCDFSGWHNNEVKSARISSERGKTPNKKNTWVKIGINYFSIWDGEKKCFDHLD